MAVLRAATLYRSYRGLTGSQYSKCQLTVLPSRMLSATGSSTSKRKNASLVIFDKDGTLICFNTMWSPHVKRVALSLEKMSGMAIREKIYHVLGFCHRTERFLPDSLFSHATEHVIKERLHQLLVNEGMNPDVAAKMLEEHTPQRADGVSELTLRAIGDVRSLFSFLRKNGVKIAVCTADSRAENGGQAHRTEVIDGTCESFSDYVDRFGIYAEANETAEARRKSVFLNLLGAQTYRRVRDLTAPNKPNVTLDTQIATLKKHLFPVPVTSLRQRPEESIRHFLAELRILAEH